MAFVIDYGNVQRHDVHVALKLSHVASGIHLRILFQFRRDLGQLLIRRLAVRRFARPRDRGAGLLERPLLLTDRQTRQHQ